MPDPIQPQPSAGPEPLAPLPLRHDTILGVCEGIGEDFGFNPTWLRIGFALLLFFQPLWTIAFYLILGVLVAASRLLFPDLRPDAPAVAAAAAPAAPLADHAIAQSPGESLEDRQGKIPLAA